MINAIINIVNRFFSSHNSIEESYLNEAVDIYDLENRIRYLDQTRGPWAIGKGGY